MVPLLSKSRESTKRWLLKLGRVDFSFIFHCLLHSNTVLGEACYFLVDLSELSLTANKTVSSANVDVLALFKLGL